MSIWASPGGGLETLALPEGTPETESPESWGEMLCFRRRLGGQVRVAAVTLVPARASGTAVVTPGLILRARELVGRGGRCFSEMSRAGSEARG